MDTVSIAKAKSHLSELISKSYYQHERIIITKRDKPVAALVSIDDLHLIEQSEEKQGLAAVAAKWQGFEEVENALGDVLEVRKKGGGGRNVSF